MLSSFHASDVEFEDEDDVFYVNFINNNGDKIEYIMLQNPREYLEQDVSLGMDKIYIERNDQIFSSYGGIESVNIHRGSIKIALADEAAKKLGNIDEIEIDFDISDEQFQGLISMLRNIFKEFGTFKES